MAPSLDDIETEDLEGPKIDRRTTLKLCMAAGGPGLAAALAGCSGDGSDENGSTDGSEGTDESEGTGGSANSGGELEIGLGTDQIESLHPYLMSLAPELDINKNVFSGLLQINANGEIVGDLAENWEIPDDTTYELTLREGVMFHNGEEFNAEAVKFSIEYLKNMDQSDESGRAESVESVEAPDDRTVVINLSEPSASFTVFLSYMGRVGIPIPPEEVQNSSIEEFNQSPVGTGPFKLSGRQAGSSLTLERFEDYYETDDDGNQLPHLDEITVNLIPEASTAWRAVETGSIQILPRVSPDLASENQGTDGIEMQEVSPAKYNAISMMCTKPHEVPELASIAGGYPVEDVTQTWEGVDMPTSDRRVRQAIVKGIDREQVVETAQYGFGYPAHGLWNPMLGELYEEEPDPGQYYDPEGARELLDEAGYTGDPRMELDLITMPGAPEREVTVIQNQLSDIGINVNLDVQQSSSFWSNYYQFTHDMGQTYSGLDIDPWNSWNRQLGIPEEGTSKGNWQKGLYLNEEFDELLVESSRTPQWDERVQIIDQAYEIFLEDAPYAMTTFPVEVLATSTNVADVESPVGNLSLRKTYMTNQ